MKKIIISVILAAAATNINAQLVVDSLGRVGIGTETPKSTLSVGTNTNEDATILCKTNGEEYGIYSMNYTNDNNSTGVYSHVKNNLGHCFGMESYAAGNYTNTYQYAVGVVGLAGIAQFGVGVWGAPKNGVTLAPNYAGVYGSETTSNYPSFANYLGTYAGFFKGKVRVTNGIYATVLSPSASASPSGQSGTTILSDRDDSVTDKLSQVQALQFLRYDPAEETQTRTNPDDVDLGNMSQEENNYLSATMGDVEPERYLSPIQYGLDADQLKEVYPELVYEDANGNVSINYVEMIPLLVQSINELSAKVAELEGISPQKAKAQPTAIEETVADIDMVRMDQNKPNPFSESTVITLNIPSNAQVANIFIYDMSGKQVQSLPVSERGETNITVYAANLTAGMYIYTLVVDGKVSVTRRMIVTL